MAEEARRPDTPERRGSNQNGGYMKETDSNKSREQEIKDYVGFVMSDVNILSTSMIPKMIEAGASLNDIKEKVDILAEAYIYTRLKVLHEGRKLIEDINKYDAAMNAEMTALIKSNARNYELGDSFT